MLGNKGAVSQIGTGIVKITRNMSSKFYLSFNSVYVFMVSGFRCQEAGTRELKPDTRNLTPFGSWYKNEIKIYYQYRHC
jgi:hypothetical protein